MESVMSLWTDDCKTAEDVWRKAAAVRERIARQKIIPKTASQAEPEPEPEPPAPPIESLPPVNPHPQSLSNHPGIEERGEAITTPRTKKQTKIVTMLNVVREHRSYWFTWNDIKGPCRKADLSSPRQEMMWLMYNGLQWSLPIIGHNIRRDHTTVLHGVRRVDDRRKLDPQLRERLDAGLVTLRSVMEKEHLNE